MDQLWRMCMGTIYRLIGTYVAVHLHRVPPCLSGPGVQSGYSIAAEAMLMVIGFPAHMVNDLFYLRYYMPVVLHGPDVALRLSLAPGV